MGQPSLGQENGVTGTGQQFGPARGDYHDTERLPMTVSKATAREIVDNPPPACRQRKAGEPAFLRASDRLGSESLASLLTIYHSIPLAREALLLPNYQQSSYGYEPLWWTGRRIEIPKILSLDDDRAHHNRDDVLIETQRLMAFLDDTNRAYASTNALADLQRYHEKEAESELSRFLEAWSEGAIARSQGDPLTQVFSSHAISEDSHGTIDKYIFCIEPMVDPEIDQSFTDILDNIIWFDQSPNGSLNDIWINSIGEIVTIKLSGSHRKQGKLGVKIPAVWYPDRYMDHFRGASRNMRVRRRNIQEKIWRLDCSRNNILSCSSADRQGKLDIREVLSEAAERAPLVIKSEQHQGGLSDRMSNPVPSSAEVNDCVKALQDLVASIEMKLAEFDNVRGELCAHLRATTAELTSPCVEPLLSPFHPYTLRGVSTKQHITYVLRPAIEALQDPESGSSVSKQWQWWRISSSTEEAKHNQAVTYGPDPRPLPSSVQRESIGAIGPFSPWSPGNTQKNQPSLDCVGNVVVYETRKLSEEDVLNAAREEDDSVTLVYASDKAVNFQGSALSGPLQMFIKADNKVFDNELRGVEQSQGLDGVANGEEMTQLHFSSANGTQGVPVIDDSDETMNGEGESSTPAPVTLSTRRGADGQPSPKRAKGGDEPPPYHENGQTVPEMQERSGGTGILGTVQPNRVGQHAGKMMESIEENAESEEKGTTQLERSSAG